MIKHTKCYVKGYPRPQFVKGGYTCLNGKWDFCFDDANVGEQKQFFKRFPRDKQIVVPFSYQTKLSEVCENARHDNIWYNRTFSVEKGSLKDKRLLLHFEGCDYITKVWVNGVFVGTHRGGYCRFSFDITNYVSAGENTLTVKAEDSFDTTQPRGKQRWQEYNFGCWYEDTNGIWKTVWLEEVPKHYLQDVKIVPNYDNETVSFTYNMPYIKQGLSVRAVISVGDRELSNTTTAIKNNRQEITVNMPDSVENFKLWQWETKNPHLYDVEFTVLDNGKPVETVGSYFAMRKFTFSNGLLMLNDYPLYLKMLLDQGYWTESHLTPPSEEALVLDIQLTKEMGFNGIRKHQKIEDELFYYYCDVLGVICWCEYPSPYEFNDATTANVLSEWAEVVTQMRNHPSIMAWVPFNESWGVQRISRNKTQQMLTETAYCLTKTLDSEMRAVISNDGWEHTRSDIITIHNYSQTGDRILEIFGNKDSVVADVHSNGKRVFANGYSYQGQPIIISEYGGIAFSKDSKNGWGYGDYVADEKAFLERLGGLNKAIRALPYVQGYCLTQTTDLMQEVNGVLCMNREPKAPIPEIKKLND